MKNIVTKILFYVVIAMVFQSCFKFEDGYRIDYKESLADLNIEFETPAYGAVGDSILFTIRAKSDYNIRSIIVNTAKYNGDEGTGYVIKSGTDSPLIDHAYGTVQNNTKELDLAYRYVIAQDTSKVEAAISLVDEEGIKTQKFTIQTVPSTVAYSDVVLCTNTSARTDGFSTLTGTTYHNMTAYATVTEANTAVQKAIDFVFITENNSVAWLASPYDGRFSANFQSKNKSLFKRMESMDNADFDKLSNGYLAYFAQLDGIDSGTTSLGDLKVGDIIGFKTDFASTNSSKYGILRIKAIHPTNCEGYEGLSFKMIMDVVTQK